MFKNFIKIAYRNTKKDGIFSIINILGLAMGLAVFLLITLFVSSELNYDKYNEKAERIFRVMADIHINGNSINGNYAPAPMGETMLKDYPQIEKVVRIRQIGNLLVKLGNEKVIESNAAFADASLFKIFTLPMLAGNPSTALVEPYSIVISESIAMKYFKSTDVLGKTLITDDTTTYKVTGVIKEMPAQSHFHFHFIKAMAEKRFDFNQAWINPYSAVYLLARPGTTNKDIDKMLEATVTKYIGPQLQKDLHNSIADLARNGDFFKYYSIPLTQIHLHSNILGEFEPNGNIQNIYLFVFIAILILMIACFNFMNLSTARSSGRAREVGVRKVLGSAKGLLIFQFLIESLLTSSIALLVAIIMVIILLPYFNQLSSTTIGISQFFTKFMAISSLIIVAVVGILAGSYPAFYLSAFNPIKVLKGRLVKGVKNSLLRNVMIVFQFTVAICLIVGILVIYSQLNFIRNKELGYNRNQILTIDNTRTLGNNAKTFLERVKKLSGVTGCTMTGSLPNRPQAGSRGFFKDATAKASETFLLEDWRVGTDFIPFFGMKIIKGRNFSAMLSTDSSRVLINETAALLLGYADPINKPLYTGPNPTLEYHILGLVKDFNNGSLRNKIDPIVFRLVPDNRAISIGVNTKNIPGLVEEIKKLYKSIANMADQPFSYSFMDDDFKGLYKSDERTAKIFISFAFFAIIIACFGLFGLVAYAAEQRRNEMTIRKVLGASVIDLVSLQSGNFLMLVLISAAIACPIAWWGMNKWLQDFAYRTMISWWMFGIAASIALLIALITVTSQAFRAAVANPVKSLRVE